MNGHWGLPISLLRTAVYRPNRAPAPGGGAATQSVERELARPGNHTLSIALLAPDDDSGLRPRFYRDAVKSRRGWNKFKLTEVMSC